MKKLSSLLFLLVGFFFFNPQPVSAQYATSCAIVDIGPQTGPTPTIPPECVNTGRRGKADCKPTDPGYICAYKNILNYTSYCCKYTGPGGHLGVDLIAPKGTEQYAVEDVIIVDNNFYGCARPDVGYTGLGSRVCEPKDDQPDGQRYYHGQSTGWRVQSQGLKSKKYYDYFHGMKQSPVIKGHIVKAGGLLAYTGRTGHSPGPEHLHLQVSSPDCKSCWSNPDIMLANYPNL